MYTKLNPFECNYRVNCWKLYVEVLSKVIRELSIFFISFLQQIGLIFYKNMMNIELFTSLTVEIQNDFLKLDIDAI